MLNDIQCRNAKPKAKPYKLTGSNGLYLEVNPSGVKAWRYRFKLAEKESVFAIGDYPAISLVDARKKREEARDLVKQGINPAHNRQLEKIKRVREDANTFEAVALKWLALKDWEEVTKNTHPGSGRAASHARHNWPAHPCFSKPRRQHQTDDRCSHAASVQEYGMVRQV